MTHPAPDDIRRERHYSVSDAAHALNVSRQTVYRWLDSGRLAVSEKNKKFSRYFIKGWSIKANIL